jgi:probable rRNA maturation factor
MNKELVIKNSSGIKINTRLLKKIVNYYVLDVLKENDFSLGIFLVKPTKIAEINEKFLQHEGHTDVISFNYSEFGDAIEELMEGRKEQLYGEIYVCPQVAFEQSKKFKAPVNEEFLRYVIHGILHIKGYDDLNPQDRKKMRNQENKAIKKIKSAFKIEELIEKSF